VAAITQVQILVTAPTPSLSTLPSDCDFFFAFFQRNKSGIAGLSLICRFSGANGARSTVEGCANEETPTFRHESLVDTSSGDRDRLEMQCLSTKVRFDKYRST
jgi:hypothetical protein